MTSRFQWVALGGLLTTMTAAISMDVQVNGQSPVPIADFTSATTAQVTDGQGQVVLQGQFMAPVEEDGGLERRATLAATGVFGGARGDAEVEFAKTTPKEQEVEFTVENLPPNLSVTFVIDGTNVATATTDVRGRADVDVKVRMPERATVTSPGAR